MRTPVAGSYFWRCPGALYWAQSIPSIISHPCQVVWGWAGHSLWLKCNLGNLLDTGHSTFEGWETRALCLRDVSAQMMQKCCCNIWGSEPYFAFLVMFRKGRFLKTSSYWVLGQKVGKMIQILNATIKQACTDNQQWDHNFKCNNQNMKKTRT